VFDPHSERDLGGSVVSIAGGESSSFYQTMGAFSHAAGPSKSHSNTQGTMDSTKLPALWDAFPHSRASRRIINQPDATSTSAWPVSERRHGATPVQSALHAVASTLEVGSNATYASESHADEEGNA